MRPDGRLAPIVAVSLLHILQSHMMRPYVPLFAASLDVGYVGVGVAAAALGVLPLFVALPAGSRADRWGQKPLILVGSAVNAVGFGLLWALPSFPTIIVTQLMAGFANLMLNLGTQTYVGNLGKDRAAERNFATYSMFASLGQIGAPPLGGIILGALGFGALFVTALALSVACGVAAIILLPAVDRRGRGEGPTTNVLRRAWRYVGQRETRLLILASGLMSIPEVLRSSFLPLFLGEVVNVQPATIGYVLALFSLAGLVARSALPFSVARFGRYSMLLAFTVACALALFALPFGTSIWAACVVTVCMGLTFGLGRPLSLAMATDASLPGELGFVVALRLSGNRIADFALPMAFGGVAAALGIGGAFAAGGALMLLGAAAFLRPAAGERRTHDR